MQVRLPAGMNDAAKQAHLCSIFTRRDATCCCGSGAPAQRAPRCLMPRPVGAPLSPAGRAAGGHAGVARGLAGVAKAAGHWPCRRAAARLFSPAMELGWLGLNRAVEWCAVVRRNAPAQLTSQAYRPPTAAVVKRQRVDGEGIWTPPEPELLQEIPGWVEALDEPCTIALFEKVAECTPISTGGRAACSQGLQQLTLWVRAAALAAACIPALLPPSEATVRALSDARQWRCAPDHALRVSATHCRRCSTIWRLPSRAGQSCGTPCSPPSCSDSECAARLPGLLVLHPHCLRMGAGLVRLPATLPGTSAPGTPDGSMPWRGISQPRPSLHSSASLPAVTFLSSWLSHPFLSCRSAFLMPAMDPPCTSPLPLNVLSPALPAPPAPPAALRPTTRTPLPISSPMSSC